MSETLIYLKPLSEYTEKEFATQYILITQFKDERSFIVIL